MVFLKTEPRQSSAPRRFAPSVNPILTPARLDLLADLELQHGHHAAAEHLSRLADEQRELQGVVR